MQMILKCADLGHLASPRDVHRQWVQHLEEVSEGPKGDCDSVVIVWL